ncbi:histidine kinase [Flavobacterium jejuense]|uniref:Histidine kinase n=1 Tax=Flavobacterium jejuense TaxID=1544455 RepID=A0ABX0IK00_9FLAO|nr:histidine kinase [Flavobacterium jejuense]NHN24155.1 histidine kinase [Flavobacterium jejuense]
MKNTCIFIFLIFFFVLKLFGQETLPFVENYSKQDYAGDNQVWSLTQGNDSAMYFANNSFLLRFDGVKWEKYTLPNKSIIRSVFSYGSKIYSGSYNEFGYWERIEGKMIYTSLSDQKNFFENNSKSEEIWKIFEVNSKIYFQSFNELFIYDNKTIIKKDFPSQISYCFIVDNFVYAATVRKGIYKFENDSFVKINAYSLIDNNIIYGIEKYKNQYYFFTQKNGVFVEKEGSVLSAWNHSINEKLKSQIIISATIFENKMLIGTAFNGLYVIDLKSNAYYNVNRSNALRNNSVLSVFVDKEKNIWLGLDNGISYLLQNSPYQVFLDNTGQLGTVYSIAKYNNGYLLATNHGVFKAIDNQLELLPNSQGQVWNITKTQHQYVIGHNEGTFTYSDTNGYKKVNELVGGWEMVKDNYSNAYIQSNYIGLYKFYNTDFTSSRKLNEKMKPVKDFIQLTPSVFLFTDGYRGLYKLKLNEKDDSFEKITNLTQQNSISNDYSVKLFKYKGTALFYIDDNWYFLDTVNDKLLLHKAFNDNFKDIQEIIPIDDSSFMVNKEGILYIINQFEDTFVWMPIPSEYYKGRLINNETKIFNIDEKYLLNMDDGFLQIDSLKYNFKNQRIKIEAYTSQNKLIYENESIAFKEQLLLYVISEYFGSKKATLFYSIDDEKVNDIGNGILEFKNLSSGHHIIKVFTIDQGSYKEVALFNFSVLNPWYFSIWMKLCYLFLVGLVFFLYYKWNKIKYTQKIRLKEEELRHKNEIDRLEIEAENKLKLQEYEKHMLENQVQSKANELAGKSLSIVKQAELIESIQKILDSETSSASLRSKISKAIKINTINKNEWKSFEDNLLKSNEDFVKKISHQYHNLTSKDIKLCIYLKMNLSSKEIAPLMNIGYRGVELHRYRLRKKMALDSSVNLNLFMNNIL